MMFGEVMDRFVEQSPASVMFRGTLENVVTAKLLDEIFAQTAKRQVCGELLFSSIVDLLALVATGSRKSVNDAYRAKKERFSVSVISVYNKLKGTETEVSRQMVRQTAMSLAEVVKRLAPRRTPLLRGYRVASGEMRSLSVAPVHVFDSSASDALVSVLCLVLYFYLEAWIFDVEGKTLIGISRDGKLDIRTENVADIKSFGEDPEKYLQPFLAG